jgi:hypothetical protein
MTNNTGGYSQGGHGGESEDILGIERGQQGKGGMEWYLYVIAEMLLK